MDRANVKILGNDATTFAACFYNEKKVAEGKAIFLGMKNFGELEKYNIHSPVVVSRYLKKIADRNPQVVHPQKHMMFSLPGKPAEEDKQRLLEYGIKVLEEMGYRGQPMIFWGHIDAGHYHIHSATVTVDKTTGMWIDNYCEGIKARRILDKLLGYNKKDKLDNLLKYKFESREQFLNLLRAVGYRQSYYNSELGVVHVRRAQEVLTNFTDEEINSQIDATGKNKDNEKERIKQLKGIILDHRRRSMDYLIDDPEVVKTKKGKKHTATGSKKGTRGAAFDGQNALGDDIKGIRKAQFKQFLEELKEKFGLFVVFSKWDGEVKGYTIVDNNKKIVFKGSDIMPLEQLLNPDWRKGQEKGTVLSSDEAANTVDVIQNEKVPEDDLAYLDDEQFDRSTLQPNELPQYIIEECDRNYISNKGIYAPNLDDIEMTAEEARKEAFFLLDAAIYENDNGNWIKAEKNADAAVAYANLAVDIYMGRRKKQQSKQAIPQKPSVERPDKQTVQNVLKPKHEDLAAIGKQERVQAIDEARETIVSYKNRFWYGLTDDDILSISMGIVARAIERGRNTLDNRAWSATLTDFKEEVDWPPLYQRKVFNTINDNIVIKYFNGLMAALQQTGLAGGPNNDLPRDKDDQWNLWKSLFGMRPPRQSKGQGVKRK